MTDETGAHGVEPGTEAGGAAAGTAGDEAGAFDSANDMELYDITVVVDRIEGRSVCGMHVGDSFEVVNSSQLKIPGHFCFYALQAVLPMIPAKQRKLPDGDWLERDSLVACPDPEERLIMRIERGALCPMRSGDLT